MTSQALPDRTAGGGLAARQRSMRTQRDFVHQNPADGLRMHVSAGEPLMAVGWRHYGRGRVVAAEWLERVEIRGAVADRVPHVGLFSAAAAAAV